MRIRELKKEIKGDYPLVVQKEIDSLSSASISKALKRARGKFVKAPYSQDGIPKYFGDEFSQVWEVRRFRIETPDGNYISGVAYRATAPVHEKGWRVSLWGINSSPSSWIGEDGRCLCCDGWGCWDCNYTGGY